MIFFPFIKQAYLFECYIMAILFYLCGGQEGNYNGDKEIRVSYVLVLAYKLEMVKIKLDDPSTKPFKTNKRWQRASKLGNRNTPSLLPLILYISYILKKKLNLIYKLSINLLIIIFYCYSLYYSQHFIIKKVYFYTSFIHSSHSIQLMKI